MQCNCIGLLNPFQKSLLLISQLLNFQNSYLHLGSIIPWPWFNTQFWLAAGCQLIPEKQHLLSTSSEIVVHQSNLRHWPHGISLYLKLVITATGTQSKTLSRGVNKVNKGCRHQCFRFVLEDLDVQEKWEKSVFIMSPTGTEVLFANKQLLSTGELWGRDPVAELELLEE